MTSITQNFWTYQLNNSVLIIDSSFSLTSISLILVTGTGTLQGTVNAGGIASDPVNLIKGMPVMVYADSNNVISGLTIDASLGQVSIIAKQ